MVDEKVIKLMNTLSDHVNIVKSNSSFTHGYIMGLKVAIKAVIRIFELDKNYKRGE